MLQDLQLYPLALRRKQLTLLYKVIEGMVPAISTDMYLMPHRNKPQICEKHSQIVFQVDRLCHTG